MRLPRLFLAASAAWVAACASALAIDKPPKGEGVSFGVTGLWLPGLMYGAQGSTGLAFVPLSLDNVRVRGRRTVVTLTPHYLQYSIPFRAIGAPLPGPADPADPIHLLYMQQVGATLEWNWYLTAGLKAAAGVVGMRQDDWPDPEPWKDYEKARIARTAPARIFTDPAERTREVTQAYVDVAWDDLDDAYGTVTGNPLEGMRAEVKVLASRENGEKQGYTRAFGQLLRYVKLSDTATLVGSFIGRWADRPMPPYAMQMYGGADYFPNQALRGYILSYLWGDWLWNLSAEYRFLFYRGKTIRLGGVAFLDSGGVGSYVAADHPGYDEGPFFGAGAGIRLFVSSALIVRIDFAVPRVGSAKSPGDLPWNFVHFGLGQTF